MDREEEGELGGNKLREVVDVYVELVVVEVVHEDAKKSEALALGLDVCVVLCG